ncbi:MAG TPA: putative Ig domain-containing protein, partial [Bryobacteraceae bacterium]|nr:putative Ig domain-containing protein [Bryobacteraceae bacterium]
MHINNHLPNALLCFSLLCAGAQRPAFPSTIDFENQCPGGVQAAGPCSSLFSNAGNAQSLNIPTAIGTVNLLGGVLLDDATNLPVDETVIYGTAGNSANIGVFPGSGFTNPLTIRFPAPITNFFLDVLNGNTMNVDYRIADNQGNSADFLLAPNLSGGQKTIGFAASGTVVTISATTGQSAPGGMTWDFFIDNVHFDEPLPSGATPEPGSMTLIGIGLAMLGLRRTRKKADLRSKVLLASLAGILLVISASAADTGLTPGLTPPALTLSDNFGDSVTIDSTGMVTCAGSGTICMPATASDSSITWSGMLGVFDVSVAGGQSKPALPSAQINLDLRVTTGAFGAGGATSATLNAKWSDLGFVGTGPTIMTATSSISGSVSATYTGNVDRTNTLFGTGTTVGAIGPITSSSSAILTGPGLTSAPFSMTETVAATMGPNSSFTLSGLSLMASPAAPLILGCATASGQVGVPYSSNLSTTGGLPPYSFSVAGSLPSGLTLNPSTGEIAGTPNTPGTFSFTPQVMDASGNTERNTVQTQCDIAVTTPPTPLALACPTPNDEEGVRYSSSLVATGGAPPYVFSITSGSLPPGLSLNPASGAISGIDTTALGSFPFTARVVGSGNGAANMAMINCLVMAAAQKLKMVAATGTTPQTVVVGTALGMPLAVIVTDADTGKPVAGVTVTFSVTIKPQNIPSGIFTGGVNNELNTMNAVDVNTDKNGLATAPTFTANGVLGNYTVIARLAGVPSVGFKLTNLVGPPFNIKATPA